MHVKKHPQSGKYFRINIENGHSQAGYDQMMHGNLFRLLDWADRMELDPDFSSRQKEVALEFYAHRCLPDLPVNDPLPPDAILFDDLVYGVFNTKSKYPGPGFTERTFLAVLPEQDLTDIDSRDPDAQYLSGEPARRGRSGYKTGQHVLCTVIESCPQGYYVLTKKGYRAILQTDMEIETNKELLAVYVCWSPIFKHIMLVPLPVTDK